MVKRTIKGKRKPLESEPEEMGLRILQPEKFKRVIVIAVIFVFIMAIIIFISSLNNVPEEQKDSGIYINTYNSTYTNRTINNEGVEAEMIDPSSGIFGIPLLWWGIAIVAWFIWRNSFRRHSIF